MPGWDDRFVAGVCHDWAEFLLEKKPTRVYMDLKD
jgi:hypothetical protein